MTASKDSSPGKLALSNAEVYRRIAESEAERLASCAREPIRTPGAVQTHGVLLVVERTNLQIVGASDNTAHLFGIETSDLLGQALESALGIDPTTLLRVIDTKSFAANPIPVIVRDRGFDAIVSTTQRFLILEFEPSLALQDYQSSAAMFASLHRLADLDDIGELWTAAARELRGLTRFDRILVYHFHADGHGEIVGEHSKAGLEPYVGLHFPASDIPPQARELYVTKLSRLIASTTDESATLLTLDSVPEAGGDLLDLSAAELRSVSPHHLQFMRNMGQGATYSLSLVHDGRLIGMITCAVERPRRLPYVLRQGLEILANQVALQISSLREIERLREQVEIRRLRARLLLQLDETEDIAAAVLDGPLTVLDLVPAEGAVLRVDGNLGTIGTTPTPTQITAMAAHLRVADQPFTILSDSLAVDHPALAKLMPQVAGLLVRPLGGDGDFVAWFRPEIMSEVSWLGDLSQTNRATPFSPRSSFSAWSHNVSGRAQEWGGLELEAEEFCRDLDRSLLRRAESKLASLAFHDPLTGLPNRRLLMDRLNHALDRHARGEELALLFIDLDHFKSINDSFGHDVGDATLVFVAEQIVSATRLQDTVARLGGDEFVVLCENTTASAAARVAKRIARAIRVPSKDRHMPAPVTISASIGVAIADITLSAEDLIRYADADMYRVKGGRPARDTDS